jgi:hypothetical protein
MKKLKKITIALLTGLISVTGALAQRPYDEGQLAVNAGFTYGFDLEELGLRAGMTYFLNENMRAGGDFTYWFLGPVAGIDRTGLEINGNFNYIFYSENELMLYGIGTLGLHYFRASFGNLSESDTELAFGLGIGGEYNIGAVSIFAEPKFMFSGFDQAKFNFGVRLYL